MTRSTTRPAVRGFLLLWLLLRVGVGSASAQADVGPVSQRGEELTVYVMTMGPGPAVWERFGHNAIRVRDELKGTDIAYNWGMFSFEQDNFLLNFIRGRMEYWMQGIDAGAMAGGYANADRSVWVQELNLSPAQRADLRDFLEWNERPENRFYLYDYYLDNCSTRVRDAIDRALGGQLRSATEGIDAGTTFRSHTRALTSEDPALYAGLMLGLARPVDRPISVWEEMFLPMELMARIREVTIVNEAGETVPLVKSELVAYERSAPLSTPDPSPRWPVHTFLGLVIAGVIVLAGVRRVDGRAGGGAFAWLATAWMAIAGIFGLVILGLWAATDHSFSYWNENLFQINPLLLVLAVMIPLAMRGSVTRTERAARWATVIAGLSVLGFLLQPLPGFTQSNGEIIGLAMPINLAIALVLVRLARARRGGGGDADRASARVTSRLAAA